MRQEILGLIPDSWGRKREVREAAIAHICLEPGAFECIANAHYFIVFQAPIPERVLALNSDQRFAGFSATGSVEIVPETSDYHSLWRTPKDSLLLGVTNERIRSLARVEHDVEDFEFSELGIGFVDQTALFLSKQIKQEIHHGGLFHEEALDALITIFSIHMLRNHSSLGKRISRLARGGLSRKGWTRVNDYIMAHLSEAMPLDKLAEISGLSPSHFARAFKESLGMPPHRYIMKMRLLAAKEEVLRSNHSISDIALSAGFSSNSHLTAAMRRAWGTTPMQLRRERGQ